MSATETQQTRVPGTDGDGDHAPAQQEQRQQQPQQPPQPGQQQQSSQQPPQPQRPADGEEQHRGHGHHPQALAEDELPKNLPKPETSTVILVLVVVAVLLAVLFLLGYIPHRHAVAEAQADANARMSSAPAVSVAYPKSEATSKDIFLPCDVRPNQQTAIFSRANGFVQQWFFDVGAHVNRGQLLALISTPDVDAQLAETQAALLQAQATVVKDQADMDVAQTDYNRYLTASKENPGSVSPQDIDAKRATVADAAGALKVAVANVKQSSAEVQQLAVTQSFEKVTAPFSGTITARNYDVGALIVPSDTTAGKELFDIADTDTLRVYVNVPQAYATDLRIGQAAYLSVRNYPKREFTGTIARTFGALDSTTRTLPYELDFVNTDGSLYAGMYGQARIPVTEPQPVLTIPSSALIFNAGGLQVALVRDNKIHIQTITVGRDLGTELEVTNGIAPDDLVVSNPGERLGEGVSVQITAQNQAAGSK